jgi:GNAT superfamily N-acetyltransferase
MHPLAALFARVARGDLPAPDGSVDVVPPPARLTAAVYSFTAHLVVATDAPEADVHAVAPPGDFAAWGAVAPWLAERAGVRAPSGDVLSCATADGRSPRLGLEPDDAFAHARVDRASRFREDVRVFVTPDRSGVLVLGRGVAGRYELAFEVEPHARNAGLGRALVAEALARVPDGEAVWAQVHPGNAASLRSVLAAGFVPVGYEQLVGTD